MSKITSSITCLPGILFKDEQSYYHAHVPALDITGYGFTKEEAKESLQLVMKIYFEKLMAERGLYKDLKEHGWMIGPHDVIPPDFTHSNLGGMLSWIKSGTSVYQMRCRIDWPGDRLFG